MKDPYELLGVSKTATKSEIKKIYRKKAKQYHPDLNPDNPEAEQTFKEMTDAYAILSDDEKRRMYDTYGPAAFEQGGMGSGMHVDISDIFGDIFDLFGGGGRRSRRRDPNGPRQGNDIQYELDLTFKEAVFGTEKKIKVPTNIDCDHCHGYGTADGTPPDPCPTCKGSGQVQRQTQSGFMNFVQTVTCPTCHGSGVQASEKCDHCGGKGREKVDRTIQVKIPAGVNDGNMLPLRGQGHEGMRGGPNGDLYVILRVQESELFDRNGNDLYFELPISFAQATLGDQVKIPTLEGQIEYEIPSGTQPGTRFTLEDKGVPDVHGRGYGNLYFDVTIDVPEELSEDQEEALRAFSASMGENPSGKKKSFFDKVKDIFD